MFVPSGAAAIVVTFEQGTLGVVSVARYNGHGYDCRLEVHGFDDTVVGLALTRLATAA